ncbi:MAG: YkgJ family cysteine cluster protein [Nanoarchaeota archaeon]|nr:YkgJ family cysteine cluster protein [Nanoarchaeota archaeon]MBU1005189.1 YkgJ family cysteine cluster protein [Nanoarchaeota archaeon]MBU1946860.1 YkgJ family cysteine cluster protein [Nanoarchaeota archaeon]
MYFESNCKNCKKHEHCCIFDDQLGFVFVGIKNAENIKRTTKKDYSYFLDYSPLPKPLASSLKDEDPVLEGKMRYHQLDKNRILRLKTKKNGKCIFLGDHGKCEIYNIRPNICRIFPFWAIRLTNNKLKVIEHDPCSDCSVVKSIAKNGSVKKNVSKKEAENIKKIFRNIEKEDIYYKKNIKKFVKRL